jgi:nucleoid-associated protein YgaU
MCSFRYRFLQRFSLRSRYVSPLMWGLTLVLGASAQQMPVSSAVSSPTTLQQTSSPTVRERALSEASFDNLSVYPPAQQLYMLSVKYPREKAAQTLAAAGTLSGQRQSRFIRATVRQQAHMHGVPEAVALGISGHESGGWKMWPRVHKKLSQRALFNQNFDPSGEVASTDWGVMQINDVAHPQAFPRARYDVEYNIAFGMALLAKTHGVYQGSLNMGFGVWDTTVAAYHLGHAPRPEEMEHTRQYIQKTQAVLQASGLRHTLNYTVMPGDTLDRIAQKQYGDASQWERIWRKNRGHLSHPTRVRVGQELVIPF